MQQIDSPVVEQMGPETGEMELFVPKTPTSAVSTARPWLTLAVVLTAAFLGALDFFIVNVSIPALQSSLHADFGQIQLMIACYGLAYAVCLITGGRLGDIYGRKRMFLVGVAGFTLASALCGLAPTPRALIAARVLQGVTGAVMFPQVLSIIQVTFPGPSRSQAFGLFGMVMGAASFSGNVLGGALVEWDIGGLSWRPIFLVNLPVGSVAFLAAMRLIRESKSRTAVRLDIGGVMLASIALGLLVYPLARGREEGWPAWAFAYLAMSVPALALFVLYERRIKRLGGSPLVELDLFQAREFRTGLATVTAFYGGLSSFFLTATLFLQQGLHLSPRQAGLTFAPFAIGFLISSAFSSRLASRIGRGAIQLGAGIMACAVLTIIAAAGSSWFAAYGPAWMGLLFVYGTGQGFVMPSLISTTLSTVPGEAAGSAAGVLTTVQQVALSMGIAVIGTVFFTILGSQPEAASYTQAVRETLWCNLGLLAATFGLAYRLPRRPYRTAEPLPLEL